MPMLCNQSSRFYCDSDEIEGLKKLLGDEEKGRDSDFDSALCLGALITLDILSTHQLRYPADFMVVFRALAFGEYTSTQKKPTDKE